MRKILVPISVEPAQMQSASAEAIALYRKDEVEVHIVNVQSIVPGFAARFFCPVNLREIQHGLGTEELGPAIALFAAAGVPCQVHVKVGRSADTIVQLAREIGCDRIVMGREAPVDVVEKLFGTLASQVRHLMSGTGSCSVIGA